MCFEAHLLAMLLFDLDSFIRLLSPLNLKTVQISKIRTVSIQSMYYFVLFLINSSMPFLRLRFLKSHSQNNSSCAGYCIATGVNAFFGCFSGFFICNDTFSSVDIQANGSRRNQWVWRSSMRDMITVSASISNSEPSITTGRLLPEASGSPNSMRTHLIAFTHPFSSARFQPGLSEGQR